MLGTTVSKVAVSVVLVAGSAWSTVGLDVAAFANPMARDAAIALDSVSLLVATLANGEFQTQWMPRDACERVESAVAAGVDVAGVRSDGVKIYIAHANCSTRWLEVDPDAVTYRRAGLVAVRPSGVAARGGHAGAGNAAVAVAAP